MGRIEENDKVFENWSCITTSRDRDETRNTLIAQQNAFLADISKSMAVIAEKDEVAVTDNRRSIIEWAFNFTSEYLAEKGFSATDLVVLNRYRKFLLDFINRKEDYEKGLGGQDDGDD